MRNRNPFSTVVRMFATTVIAILWFWLAGCGEKGTPLETNLLENPSFEEVVDGVPVGWEIRTFKGLESDIPADAGIDENRAYEGQRSFFFEALPETRRFYLLTQEVEVKNVRRLRVKAAVKTLEIRRGKGQYPQANIALTFFDQDRNRFQSVRYYDRRTRAITGTTADWVNENRVFRIPDNTAYVQFQLALGMEGKIWFDDVSLEVPTGLPWNIAESKNFTFHSLPGTDYPEGSMDYQQQLFDYYCTRLGVPEADRTRIFTYYYPDSATLYETIGVRQPKKSYWDEREVHSLHPVDDHEIIHIITKPYGVLPFALTEGTAFYLIGEYRGEPVLMVARRLLDENRLMSTQQMLTPGIMRKLNPDLVAPAAASFVGYLLEMGGTSKFLDLHREANATNSPEEFSTAFEAVYETPLEEADAEWKKLLGRMDFSGDSKTDSTEVEQQR